MIGAKIAVSAMPATAVGTANGKSTIASLLARLYDVDGDPSDGSALGEGGATAYRSKGCLSGETLVAVLEPVADPPQAQRRVDAESQPRQSRTARKSLSSRSSASSRSSSRLTTSS